MMLLMLLRIMLLKLTLNLSKSAALGFNHGEEFGGRRGLPGTVFVSHDDGEGFVELGLDGEIYGDSTGLMVSGCSGAVGVIWRNSGWAVL